MGDLLIVGLNSDKSVSRLKGKMSAIFYQLTVSAAQLCAPVTAVADGDWTGWLDHWQTLLGAAVGGLIGGIVGAMIGTSLH